jgi:putative ABC transport system permease protein
MPRTVVGGIEWSKAKPQFWVPFAVRDSQLEPYGDFNHECIGRLRTGVSVSQAHAELNALQTQIASTIPAKVELRAKLVPLREQVTGESRAGLLLLFAAVGVVLLIGCVNVANLLLARGSGRGREFAIRVAVGASRAHLLKQSLTESFVLAAIGGMLGICLAYASFGFLIAHAPADLPRLDEVSMDTPVLLFALLVTVVTGALSGLLPAARHARVDPQEALKSGSHTVSEGRRGAQLRSTLVSLEVALSTVCLIAVGLLLHSFIQLMRVDKGFSVQRVLMSD